MKQQPASLLRLLCLTGGVFGAVQGMAAEWPVPAVTGSPCRHTVWCAA